MLVFLCRARNRAAQGLMSDGHPRLAAQFIRPMSSQPSQALTTWEQQFAVTVHFSPQLLLMYLITLSFHTINHLYNLT